MRSFSSGVAVAALAIAAAATAGARAKPNFSGNWKLNAAKSDFGAMPAPDSRSDTITHAGPQLKDAVTQSGQMGSFEVEFRYFTDGRETVNDLRGTKFKSRAKWEGDELVIVAEGSLKGAGVTMNDRWSLSPDGKTLTIRRHAVTPMGETDQKIVLEKQ